MATKTKKPTTLPATPFPTASEKLHETGNWLWIPLCREWRDTTNKPEEVVRQKFIRVLVDHYGYDLDQILQEQRTQAGNRSPRVDIVVFETPLCRTS